MGRRVVDLWNVLEGGVEGAFGDVDREDEDGVDEGGRGKRVASSACAWEPKDGLIWCVSGCALNGEGAEFDSARNIEV